MITRPEESYRVCVSVVCEFEISTVRRPRPKLDCCVKKKEETSICMSEYEKL